MRWSPERLRWVLLAGVFALAAVLAALFGMANYRAGKIWQRILARNGVNIRRESNGVTYSQTKGGRTIFVVHAANSVPHGDGQWTLHDAVLILYGKNGRNDRISGNEFEYDQKQGILRAMGEVHLDLQAPATDPQKVNEPSSPALSFAPDDESANDPALIHVRTSGLVYNRKLNVATTNEPAEFRYRGMTCTSRGAEFDSGHNLLQLLADVQLSGTLRDAPFTLTASHADLARDSNTIDLLHPVMISGQRAAQAVHAVLHLRRNGTLQTGDAEGGVELHEGTRTLSAPRAHAIFAEENRPEGAQMTGGVRFADANQQRPATGSAQTLNLQMDGHGLLQTASGSGTVRFVAHEGGAAGPVRQMTGDAAQASFAPEGGRSKRSLLQLLKVTGHASFSGNSDTAKQGKAATVVSADVLTTSFVAGQGGRAQPQRMVGDGHTQLEQTRANGAHQISTGTTLDATFAPRTDAGPTSGGAALEVSSAIQTGDVEIRSWAAPKAGEAPATMEPSTGHAERAVYVAAEETLTLTGDGTGVAEVQDAETQMRAPSITLHQGTGNADASGGVAATTGGTSGSPATHVLAERAALLHGPQISQFFGTEAHPAQLWQGGSQVQAARIVIDGAQHTLSASPGGAGGRVHAIFASARTAKPSGEPPLRNETAGGEQRGPQTRMPEASRDAVAVAAESMEFNDLQHEAVFHGGVEMRGTAGVITGDHGAAFLAPRPAPAAPDRTGPTAGAGFATAGLSGQLQRMVILGNVHLREPGRSGTGAQLTYTAQSDQYVLTGTPTDPPRVVDAQQGLVTGATLVFGASDSSIVVAGLPAQEKQGKPTRVHTETDLKPR